MATIENFITTLDLKNLVIQNGPDKGELVEHFIYASSIYGTTFGVFCKIEGEELNKDSFKINTLLLRIINYVGVINIGFLNNEVGQSHSAYDRKRETVSFAVQGANSCDELSIDLKSEKVIVTSIVPVTLTFERTLHPLKDFVALNKDVPSRTEQSAYPVPKKDLFDTEFNYRNGVDLYYQLLRPGMLGFESTRQPLPSPRCHQSFVRFIFQ